MIAVVFVSFLANIFVGVLSRTPHAENYTTPVGIGILLVVWWVAYIAILRYKMWKNKGNGSS